MRYLKVGNHEREERQEKNSWEENFCCRIPITNVPCGCSRFLGEIFKFPESILKDKYKNLVHLTAHRNGGHFAALEVPETLAADIYDFVEKVEMLNWFYEMLSNINIEYCYIHSNTVQFSLNK